MAETLTVRQSHPSDLAELDRMFAQTYPKLLKADYPPSVLVTALPLISKAQPKLLASGRYFVAEQSGQIVGAGGWSPHRRADLAEIRHVVTDHRHQRRGIARALLHQVVEHARAAGIKRLNCQSTRTAVPFYQAIGFTPLGPIEVPLAAGISFPAIQMQRQL